MERHRITVHREHHLTFIREGPKVHAQVFTSGEHLADKFAASDLMLEALKDARSQFPDCMCSVCKKIDTAMAAAEGKEIDNADTK